ncbi:MAG: RlmI/RlmK family 23S rRNA methyltransferase, partial [Stellaceae bacterium]
MSAAETRPVVKLQPGRNKRVESGHPWVYSNEVAMDAAAKALIPGTLV